MLSNAYFLAKFRFDTAENEPAKNLQNFRKMHFRKMHFQKMHFRKMHSKVRALGQPARDGLGLHGRHGGDQVRARKEAADDLLGEAHQVHRPLRPRVDASARSKLN